MSSLLSGLLAGLEKVKILREPEAAALAYGLEKREDELILVGKAGGSLSWSDKGCMSGV